ncbi:MAG: carboxymethylenebutenolidase [Candidatus Eremiobacteraeota bacterium]|jgi:carboxymethylenebutenolidase|nr:carboxymethylenebutenolidase [Candidatus Eremiobacteraeota bacterium]
MITETTTINGQRGPMPAYIARLDDRPRPAVIVLEGIYGFDSELRRITDLVASAGYVGCAIDYLRGQNVAQGFHTATMEDDLAMTRDWLNERKYVAHGKIAAWGFGVGGAVAFIGAMLPGMSAAIAFYGQSISKGLPDGGDAPIKDADKIRTPLLLVYGGADTEVTQPEIDRIRTRLTAAGKTADVQIYPSVGHSFFRQDLGTIASREIADAWDRVVSFLRRSFA